MCAVWEVKICLLLDKYAPGNFCYFFVENSLLCCLLVSSSRWPQYHWQILHIGPDGCIRGSLEPYKVMKGPCINDGLWHHVALSASPDQQCMFVDGHVACSINVGIGRGLHRCVY